jgi:hypothetical protein
MDFLLKNKIHSLNTRQFQANDSVLNPLNFYNIEKKEISTRTIKRQNNEKCYGFVVISGAIGGMGKTGKPSN